MPVEIDEVLRRSEQGMTNPYICRGSDGKLYFVKGKGAGYASLVREWIVGQLALRLELPIAPFCIVEVPRELYEASHNGLLSDLGCGLFFGSENVENTTQLSFSVAQQVSIDLKRNIAAFDWWIQNGDRTLSETDGNPNLLWSETAQRLIVIDHNVAFDETVTLDTLFASHIFGSSLSELCDQVQLQSHYNALFDGAVQDLPKIIDDIPERWLYADDACTVDIDLSLRRVEDILMRYRVPSFWERT